MSKELRRMEQFAAPLGFNGGDLSGGSLNLNDPDLHFGGPEGVLSQETDDVYTLTITNTGAAVRTARLFAPDSSSTGRCVEGAFNDTAGNAGLSGAGAPTTVAWINEFIRFNPGLISKMYLVTDDAANLGYTWSIYDWSPFKANAFSYQIRPTALTNEYRNQGTELTIRKEIYAGSQSYIDIPVKDGTYLTIHMTFLAFNNQQLAFFNKVARAKGVIAATLAMSGR